MKHLRYYALALALSAPLAGSLARAHTTVSTPTVEQHESAGYKYETVPNDPIDARIYTLKNGMKVFLTVNKNEPRIQTMIAVRAGSKNDPADATGLAHYLEHLLFKGTDQFGSLDYAKEKPYLDEIENLYETYRGTTDVSARAAIYHQIDSVSGVASKYAIANEYDKMLTELGAKGTNAHTSNEETVYVNDIPSNQIEKWLTIEGERFRNPVIRLFHTELEAVYEEKNRHLDNDNGEVYEVTNAALFQNHPYGTQTTIGTIDHLKNPSIKKIKDFYSRYYVPGNMAVVLSGDFDPDQVIKLVDQKFSSLPSKPVPAFSFQPEAPITQPIVREVYGPDAESVQLAYRFPGKNTHEADLLEMADEVLSNSAAGLIDLNLNQQQKVLHATSGPQRLTDYSVHYLSGSPKEGQSLDDVRDLLLSQVELLKKGQFDASLLPAIVNDLTINKIRSYESNGGRAQDLTDAFIHHTNWSDEVNHLNALSKITKQEVVDFANKYYGSNYVIVYKRNGERKNVQKVTKPPITAVSMNRTAQSDFLKSTIAMPAGKIQPRFVDYKNDIREAKLTSGVPVYYLHNDENKLFTMYYVLDMGNRNDKKIGYAVSYLNFLGTDKLTNEDIKKKFFSLGSSFNVSASDDQVYVSLTGLEKNFAESTKLFENLLANAKPDDAALKQFVARTMKSRKDTKKNRGAILNVALKNYAMYGKTNPLTNGLTNAELQQMTASELVDRIHSLTSYPHHVLFYGPQQPNAVVASLNSLHTAPASWKTIPAAVNYTFQDTKNKVYFVNYDMAQAEVVMLSKGMQQYDPKSAPIVRLYNEYFGGGMSSVVFQNIRESKALAYAVFSGYSTPTKLEDPYFVNSYVGTQADKMPETMKSMFEMLNDMPRVDQVFAQAKTAIQNKIETERITRTNILMQYETARRMGLDHDIRQDVYAQVPQMTYDQVAAWQKQNIKDRQYAILVLGSKDKIDMKDLAKYGDIQELSLDEVFGY